MSSPALAPIGRSTSRRRAPLGLVASLLVGGSILLSACGGGSSASTAATTDEPTATSIPASAGAGPTTFAATVHLDPVITGLDQPVAMAARPGRNQLWVAELGGRIRVVSRTTTWNTASGSVERTGYSVTPRPVLDLSTEITADARSGLFDLAFSSDGQTLVVAHSTAEGDTVIARYTIVDQMDHRTDVLITTDARTPDIAPVATTSTTTPAGAPRPTDPTAERPTASTITPGPIPKPTIDPTSRVVLLTLPTASSTVHGARLLLGPDGYLTIGVPSSGTRSGDRGEDPIADDPHSLLGKILRIDIASADGTRPYAIPDTNPYTGDEGVGEVWRTGVLDPLWFTFDRTTHELRLTDDLRQSPSGTGRGADCVIGGYVYRGAAIAGFSGVEVYADHCTGELRGRLARNGVTLDDHRLGGATDGATVVSFGQDDQGELYAVSSEGTLSVIMGGR